MKMNLTTVMAFVAAAPAWAQPQAAPADPLSGRFQWEAKAPWGVAHRESLINLIKLTTMNPMQLDAIREEPFKIFDNLYYVGAKHVCAYLMTTSEGLVLMDSLFGDTTDLLTENIRKLGFNPEEIKYIFISHSHPDHFGGAGKIKEMSGARVIMSKEDWDEVERQQAAAKQSGRNLGLPLKRDIVKGDGDTLKIGGQEFKFYFTPGHSPGALSAEFQVKDRGKTYRALAPGGMGTQFPVEMTEQYIKGLERLRALSPFDVMIGNHPIYMVPEMADLKRAVANLGDGPHPLVTGPEIINQWLEGGMGIAREKQGAESKLSRP